MNRFLIAAITLVALTAAAQAEIICTQHLAGFETGLTFLVMAALA